MEFEKWFESFCKDKNISEISLKQIAEIAYHEGYFEHQRNTPVLARVVSTNELLVIEPEDSRPLPEGEKWATDEELENFDFKAELEKQKKEEKNELE